MGCAFSYSQKGQCNIGWVKVVKNKEILAVVDAVANEKRIEKGRVFEAIEQALATAAKKVSGEEQDIHVIIDRDTGSYITYRRWSVLSDDEASYVSANSENFPYEDIVFSDFESCDEAEPLIDRHDHSNAPPNRPGPCNIHDADLLTSSGTQKHDANVSRGGVHAEATTAVRHHANKHTQNPSWRLLSSSARLRGRAMVGFAKKSSAGVDVPCSLTAEKQTRRRKKLNTAAKQQNKITGIFIG